MSGTARGSAATAPSTAVRIGVVICTHDPRRWDLLRAAVASVRAQEPSPDHLVVVVDHHEGLLRCVRDEWPDVEAIANPGARGLSAARNAGTDTCRCDVVAFLDDDAAARPGWIAGLRAAFADPGTVGAGGPVVPGWADARPPWFPAEFDWVVGCTHAGMPVGAAEIRNPVGANMAFRRDALRRAGGFRPDLGRVGLNTAGCEETELAVRLRSSAPGRRIVFTPDAAVTHHVPASRARWGYFLRRCVGEGRSKAMMSTVVRSPAALGTELHYTLRTLPAGIGRAVADALHQRRGAPLTRAGAILAGLAATTAGFGWQRARLLLRRAAP